MVVCEGRIVLQLGLWLSGSGDFGHKKICVALGVVLDYDLDFLSAQVATQQARLFYHGIFKLILDLV